MKSRLISIMQKNVLYLFSLMLSVILWFYVLSTEPLELNKTVKVNYVLGDGKVISSEAPSKIQVKITGPRAFMRAFEVRELPMDVDLRQVVENEKGDILVTTDIMDLHLPFGIQLVDASPASFTVKLVHEGRKVVDVIPKIVGKVDENQKLIRSEVRPKTVTIVGAPTLLNQVNHIETGAIDMTTLEGEGTLNVSLTPPDHRILIRPAEGTYNYLIRPTKANMQLNNIRIRFLSSRPIQRASAKTVSLLVLSEKGEDVQIRVSDVNVVADVPEGETGRVKVNMRVDLPAGIHLLKVQPENIYVNIK